MSSLRTLSVGLGKLFPWTVVLLLGVFLWGGAVLGPRCLRGQEQIDVLRQQLGKGQTDEVLRAAEQLGRLGKAAAPAVPDLVALLDHTDPLVRAAGLRALGAVGPEAAGAVAKVIARLDDRDLAGSIPLWQIASETLGQMGEAAVPALIQQLDPRRPQRYYGACAALQRIGPAAAQAVPKLVDLAMRDDEDSQPALHALRGLGPAAKDALPMLMKLLDSRDFHNQYLACRVIGALGEHGQPATGKLCQLLTSGVASVRRNAAAALGQIGPSIGDEGIDCLIRAVEDPLQPVREEAVIALGRIGPPAARAVSILKEAVTTDRLGVKARAAGALYRVSPQEVELAMTVLLRELQGLNAPWAAAEELAYVAPRAGRVADVAKLLDADSEETQAAAADALAGMGKAAEPYLETLNKIANDASRDPEVREAARTAIEKIRQASQ
jgi:HEAT repeat protein